MPNATGLTRHDTEFMKITAPMRRAIKDRHSASSHRVVNAIEMTMVSSWLADIVGISDRPDRQPSHRGDEPPARHGRLPDRDDADVLVPLQPARSVARGQDGVPL
jgi:hypothetical protein